jgi:Histidine acid phosphatase.
MIGQRYRPENEEPFTDHWHIQAYSTNYLRTVKSLQCFLDGLFSDGHHLAGYSENGYFYEHVDPESYLQTNHIPKVEILVRDPKDETLNRFDTAPDVMRRLVQDVVKTPDFVDQDAKAAPLAARLSNYIPGLIRLRSPHGIHPLSIGFMQLIILSVDHRTTSIKCIFSTRAQSRCGANLTIHEACHNGSPCNQVSILVQKSNIIGRDDVIIVN